MTTQSIIVYHNPLQAALWEGGYIVPVFASMGVGLLVLVLLLWIADKVKRDWRGPSNWVVAAASLVSIAVTVLVFNYLFI